MNKKLTRTSALLLTLAAIFVFITGCKCTSSEADKIVNVPSSHVKEMKESREATGMQKAWIDHKALQKYNKAILNVQLSSEMIKGTTRDNLTTWRLVSSQSEDNKYIEDYTKKSLSTAFTRSKEFTISTKKAPETLQINLYLVQIVPGDGVMGTLSNLPLSPVSLVIKPIGMGLHGYSNSAGGAAAVEVVIRDSLSGKVLAVFASREKSTTSIINTDEFGALGAVRTIVDTWTKNMVSTLDKVKRGKEELKVDSNIKGFSLINY